MMKIIIGGSALLFLLVTILTCCMCCKKNKKESNYTYNVFGPKVDEETLDDSSRGASQEINN